ncbi:hypothetical protein PM082_004629 [Marasmius tenuissimus]|nr:hypothetical protein PM082_004629 [Marasmius tenuissimus]
MRFSASKCALNGAPFIQANAEKAPNSAVFPRQNSGLCQRHCHLRFLASYFQVHFDTLPRSTAVLSFPQRPL